MEKTIFILLDGCGFQAAGDRCGFMEHMVEVGQAAKYRVRGELPSTSRSMYETLLTGLPVWRHGIACNAVNRRSNCETVFDLCRKAGLKTAAAAYSWVSELYIRTPFCGARDRFQLNSESSIQNGIYYSADQYPDSHLFWDGEFLRESTDPDFLMIHSMGVDYAGHGYGVQSEEYQGTITAVDEKIATLLPAWRAAGYQVVVTADHGMDETKGHGGNTPEQRMVPLYLFSDEVKVGDFTAEVISQLEIAPLLCRLLGLAPGQEMGKPDSIQWRMDSDGKGLAK